MTWPFVRPIRPMMRDVLFWHSRGESWEQIYDRLTGPGVGHRAEEVAQAIPEARRALYFREEIGRAPEGQTFAEMWLNQARAIWYAAYGRPPSEAEMEWWTTRPGRELGMMFEVTIEGVPGFRWTPTVNAGWNETLADVQQRVIDWFMTAQRSPPPPGSAAEAIQSGAKISANLVGGVLVPRIEPTIG